jgi:hypothetical protein
MAKSATDKTVHRGNPTVQTTSPPYRRRPSNGVELGIVGPACSRFDRHVNGDSSALERPPPTYANEVIGDATRAQRPPPTSANEVIGDASRAQRPPPTTRLPAALYRVARSATSSPARTNPSCRTTCTVAQHSYPQAREGIHGWFWWPARRARPSRPQARSPWPWTASWSSITQPLAVASTVVVFGGGDVLRIHPTHRR